MTQEGFSFEIISLQGLYIYLNHQTVMADKNHKVSSSSAVLALYNNMLGGALLSFPILYRDAGIISSSIVILISCLIAYSTCRIYILHSKSSEINGQTSINRILGPRGEKQFRLITGIYIIFLNVIYLDLIVDQLYSIIFYFFDMTGDPEAIARKDSLQFGKFSTQWLTIILFLPLFALISIKKMGFLVKLCQYGSFTIFIYMIYVVYQFSRSAIQGTIPMDSVTWFSMDIGNLAGTSALAFTVHTVVGSFLKQTKEPEHQERDLKITYSMGFFTYQLVAIFGALAIVGKPCKNTFVDCYLTEWTILIVEITYFLGRVSSFPIMVEICRTRILQLFYGEVTKNHFMIFNISFMIFSSVISIMSPKLPLSILMSLVGALLCYFFIYLIPTRIHFACLYPKAKKVESVITESQSQEVVDGGQGGESLLVKGERGECNHHADYVNKRPKYLRWLMYGGFNLVGITIGIFGMYSSIKSVVDNNSE